MQKFKAYRTFEENNVVTSRFVEMALDELDPGDVVVRTKYSTINYKDALSYNGAGKIMRKYPTNAGIDMAGTVETSQDPRWKRGDKVIVHAYDFGVSHDGGYAEHVRVPGDWIVRRPESMTAFDAMTLGTAGYTAAQAIMLMEHNGLKPDNGPVAVTGATGGVGSVAIEILAKIGYHVVAITGKPEEARLPARTRREGSAAAPVDRPHEDPPARQGDVGRRVDNLGGDMLAWLLSTSKIGGTVAAVGLAAGMKLNTTVMPFILRGVLAARRRQRQYADVAAPEDLEQARGRMASRPRPRPGAHDRLRRTADALRPVPQGHGARTHGGAHRARHARRMRGRNRVRGAGTHIACALA